MPELIIRSSLLTIGQNTVCLRKFFEAGLCFLIAGIFVRVVFYCKTPICLFYFSFTRIFVDFKDFVIILFSQNDILTFTFPCSKQTKNIRQRLPEQPLPDIQTMATWGKLTTQWHMPKARAPAFSLTMQLCNYLPCQLHAPVAHAGDYFFLSSSTSSYSASTTSSSPAASPCSAPSPASPSC